MADKTNEKTADVGPSDLSDVLAWCPTQSGKFTAYEPVWRPRQRAEDTQECEWQRVPTRTEWDRPDLGVPEPLCMGGVSKTIGLCGHAQAQALAWQFAAQAEARGKHIEVRAQAYEVVYEIKARKIES